MPAPRASSPIPVLLAILLLGTAAALAEDASSPSARSVLLSPVTSRLDDPSLVQALQQAVPAELARAGFRVVEHRPEASVFPEWQSRVTGSDTLGPVMIEDATCDMAIAAGTDVYLVLEVTSLRPQAALSAVVTSTVARRTAAMELLAPAGERTNATAAALARDLARKLTPELWQQLGADTESRVAAAPERFAAAAAERAAGRPRAAAREFAAAALGDPGNPQYLEAAAEAYLAIRSAWAALDCYQRLAELRPDDPDPLARMGDAALQAREPTRAEAAFRRLATLAPDDLRAVEGLARVARARGDAAGAERLYRQLVARLPAFAPHADWLPALLAEPRGDELWLTRVPPEEVGLALGQLCLSAGRVAEGVQALLAYQRRAPHAVYADRDYLALAAALDEESEWLARRVALLSARPVGELGNDRTETELDALHARSDQLATLAEGMRVSPLLDPAHRYRVLAYNLLNQSNFEGLLYFRTHDPERERRADLLREAFRKARAQAQQLGEGLAAGPP